MLFPISAFWHQPKNGNMLIVNHSDWTNFLMHLCALACVESQWSYGVDSGLMFERVKSGLDHCAVPFDKALYAHCLSSPAAVNGPHLVINWRQGGSHNLAGNLQP